MIGNKLIRFLFKEKKVIIVSDNEITTKRYNPLNNIIKFCFIIWCCFTTFFYFKDRQVIKNKDKYIIQLTQSNSELKNGISTLANLFKNVRSYFVSLNSYDRFKSFETANLGKNISIVNKEFLDNKAYNNVLPILARVDEETNNINKLIDSRINNIENLVSSTGISKNKLKNIYTVNLDKSEKYSSSEYSLSKESPIKKTDFDDLNKKIDYLSYLESFINTMPLTNPVDNYRITSSFGNRVDPIDKKIRFHKGIDLAAPLNAKVISTADGEVIYAGNRKGYGNYVKVKHKNAITTEYGHMKTVKVKVGDIIKRGDVLGTQGNTGRSTGAHLHYEVKVNNEAIDPKNFINVGNKVY